MDTGAVTIVLPPKLMAGHPATLAVFGLNGRLDPGLSVNLSDGESVTTDGTGRAHFTAPAAGGYLVAKAEGSSAAALVDPAAGASEPQTTSLPPVASLQESLWLCGAGLQGEAGADRVTINGHFALVLAASPECLVVLPPPDSASGRAKISVDAPGVHWTAVTTLVSLGFQPPFPVLLPDKKGRLLVRVNGTTEPLDLIVENRSPGVLRFLRGDVQQLRTSGGTSNFADVDVQAIRSGDYRFHAHLISAPDSEMAARYLQAAVPVAPRRLKHHLEDLADRIAQHPRDIDSERRDLARILERTAPGDFRTLLAASYSDL
jgi:hypothetical protein